MKIYIDFIIFINFFFDFLLLLSTTIFLKYKINFKRIFIASIIGSLSIFILFIDKNNFFFLIYKLIISIIMIMIVFGLKNILKNIISLYFISIFLGGFLYFINNMFSYRVDGFLFINNGYSINIILIILLSPIIIYIYILENRNNKIINNIYNVSIKYLNKTYNYQGYLDTGNNLYDPYFHKPICILSDNSLIIKKSFIVPYNTLNECGILTCIKVEELKINNKEYKNVYIGISNNKFSLNNCEMIIHRDFL